MDDNWRRLVWCQEHKVSESVDAILHKRARHADVDVFEVTVVLPCGQTSKVVASAANVEAMK